MTEPKVRFDPFSAEYFCDPYEIYHGLRDETPVYYSDQYDFYVLARHEDVAATFKDFEVYASASGTMLEEVLSGSMQGQSIISMDPPEHRRMRGLVNKAFTPGHPGAGTAATHGNWRSTCPTGSPCLRCGRRLLGTVSGRNYHRHAGRPAVQPSVNTRVARYPAETAAWSDGYDSSRYRGRHEHRNVVLQPDPAAPLRPA